MNLKLVAGHTARLMTESLTRKPLTVQSSALPPIKKCLPGRSRSIGSLTLAVMAAWGLTGAAFAAGDAAEAKPELQAETAGDAQAGQAKAATCVACHGLDGNSSNPEWPSLAGQHAEYIQKQLQEFKSGARQNVVMAPMAVSLSEQDMWDLGAYFAAQTSKGLEAEPSKVNVGQRLYRAGDPVKHIAACAACHGPAGHGNPAAKYPSLHGQHAVYLTAQLHAYRDGKRTTDQNSMMRNIAAALSEEQIDAVTSYIQGLR